VGNGDVITLEDYIRMREETGCDAVMIGRGALGNPWLFRAIQEHLRGEAVTQPTTEDRKNVFARHVDLIVAHAPKKKLVHELRKAVAWYTKGLRNSAEVRARAFNVDDPVQVREIAFAYFSSLDQEKSARAEFVSLVDKLSRQVA
jgi:tRNA-dihydrouridine synthase